MKKIILSLALLLAGMSAPIMAMDDENSVKLSFVAASPDEDLTPYMAILQGVYQKEHAGNDKDRQEYLAQIVQGTHPVLLKWVGQDGKRFIKILDGQKPVGAMTLRVLDEEQTQIAMHQSALLPEYKTHYGQFFDSVKEEFPKAEKVYTTCSPKVPALIALIKHYGFKEDNAYMGSQELHDAAPDVDCSDLQGYCKTLD